MINTKKYYFLPIVDHITAVVITIVMMLLFGTWLSIPAVGAIATFFTLLTLCGRTYVRMWKLSQKNTLRQYGLTKNDFMKFALPIVIIDLVLIVFYLLCEYNIIPLKDIVTNTYYTFPDNLPREIKTTTAFEYAGLVVKLWFFFLTLIAKNVYVFLLAPVLSFLSIMLGYKLGAKSKEITNVFVKVTEKAKKKFNE